MNAVEDFEAIRKIARFQLVETKRWYYVVNWIIEHEATGTLNDDVLAQIRRESWAMRDHRSDITALLQGADLAEVPPCNVEMHRIYDAEHLS